jgi:hypothetical protein
LIFKAISCLQRRGTRRLIHRGCNASSLLIDTPPWMADPLGRRGYSRKGAGPRRWRPEAGTWRAGPSSKRRRFVMPEGTSAANSLTFQIQDVLPSTRDAYYKLILAVGPPRIGKTAALSELAARHDWPRLNVNLRLSERLLDLTHRQRAVRVAGILDDIVRETASTSFCWTISSCYSPRNWRRIRFGFSSRFLGIGQLSQHGREPLMAPL